MVSRPVVTRPRPRATVILVPMRSTSLALSGETTIIAAANGSIRTPVSSGE